MNKLSLYKACNNCNCLHLERYAFCKNCHKSVNIDFCPGFIHYKPFMPIFLDEQLLIPVPKSIIFNYIWFSK